MRTPTHFFTATALANVSIHAASTAFPPRDVAALLVDFSKRNHETLYHNSPGQEPPAMVGRSYTVDGLATSSSLSLEALLGEPMEGVWDEAIAAEDLAHDLPDGVSYDPGDGPAALDQILDAMITQIGEDASYTHREALAVIPLMRRGLVAPDGTDLATPSILEGLTILDAHIRG
jgi:hypothetical protein